LIGQIIVTVPQAKQLIAQAILQLPEVKHALEHGQVVLKAGTTVSALAEMLGVPPMRLGGRIVPDGARGPRKMADAPHIAVIEQGEWHNADTTLPEEIVKIGPNDVFITGANALDCHGVAGLLSGVEGGSVAGKSLTALWTEGIPLVIAVGMEKLISGSIIEISQQTGRKRVDKVMGMAVGMIPLVGHVVTEREALEILTGVKTTVIAAGGINGAEGATMLQIEGERKQIEGVFDLIVALKDVSTCGNIESRKSCEIGGPMCHVHVNCLYKQQQNK
jgi:hypothetical protein